MRMYKILGRFPVVLRSDKPQWVVKIRERKGEAEVLLSLKRTLLDEEGCAFLSSPNPPFLSPVQNDAKSSSTISSAS